MSESTLFGRLTLDAFKHDMVAIGGAVSMGLATIAVLALVTYLRRWRWLWHEWLTSFDPKKIGAMYIIVASVMLLKGVIDAAMMRAQQAIAISPTAGYLSADHFQQVFSAHGSTMIFFVAMGFIFGLFNLIIPLQIGARDVAFPFLNSLSYWLFVAGAVLLNLSLAIGEFSAAGWLAYPPLAGIEYNPGVGVDYWIWSLQIAGAGSLLSGINFLVTIFKLRAPGMSFMKLPVFIWSCIGSLSLIVFAFPILTVTLALLSLDRLFGMHFFTADFGGNPMMFVNLIWAWGHPEVYILVLPAFGIFSEVVATFSQKRLFGYVSMVWAIGTITFLSFIVWVHHFFTMGAGPSVNAFFGIMTMLIAVPTGVKIFNWLFTLYKGQINFSTPMLWFLGFIFVFTLGGMSGVLLSVPAVDFQVHNSLFLVAHFHSTIIGGVLFGLFAGVTYWFPKFTGFKLNETLGRYAFWCWFVGFFIAFTPLYILGLMGATRRLDHYDPSMGWQPLFIVAAFGVVIILCGIGLQLAQLIISIRQRSQNRDTTGDPWNGRTLEWSTSSPPPFYNFASIPHVEARDQFWEQKRKARTQKEHLVQPIEYESIHMPKNSAMGLYIAGTSFLVGFAAIWHITWLAIVAFFCTVSLVILRLSDDEVEYVIPAEEVNRMERGSGVTSV